MTDELFGWSTLRRGLRTIWFGGSGFTRAGAWPMTAARCRSSSDPTAPSGDTLSTRSQTIPFQHTTTHKHFQNGARRSDCTVLLLLTNQTGSTELRRHPDAARCTFTKATPLLVSTPDRISPTSTCVRSDKLVPWILDIHTVNEARSAGMMSCPIIRADTQQ